MEEREIFDKPERCIINLEVDCMVFVNDQSLRKGAGSCSVGVVDDQDDGNDNIDDNVVLRNGSLRTRSPGSPCSQCWLQFRFELTPIDYFCLLFNTHCLLRQCML